MLPIKEHYPRFFKSGSWCHIEYLSSTAGLSCAVCLVTHSHKRRNTYPSLIGRVALQDFDPLVISHLFENVFDFAGDLAPYVRRITQFRLAVMFP